jgi:hypothetical protein
MALEQLLVVGQAAGAVAHRVGVLAQYERQAAAVRVQVQVVQRLLLTPADRIHLLQRGVHAGVHVHMAAVPVAFIVDWPGGVAVAGPIGHRGQVVAGAGFVAEGPHDDARMVLVPLDHAGHPVQVRLPPARVPARVAAPADRPEAVGLQVALVHHPQSVLVAQLEKTRVGRIVAGADRIDVVPLHQEDVGQHGGLIQGAAGLRVKLVPVHAPEQDPPPVDPQQAVLDRDRTEPDLQGDGLATGTQLGVVQPWHLGRPRLDGEPVRPGRGDVTQAELGYRERGGHRGVDPEDAGTCQMVVVGVDEEVLDNRLGLQRHIPEDPRQPPHVLVLEVARRRPLMDPHCQYVAPGSQQDIELGG